MEVKNKLTSNLKEQERSEAESITPIRKKLVTDQKIKNIVRKFEDDDIPNDLEVMRMLPRPTR